jgi:hypothetical protein
MRSRHERYSLVEVERFPEPIESGKLYWSREFGMSAHRCACGCGDVIYLPVGPVDYTISDDPGGPSLRPSVGNWNICNAHYFITNGGVQWAGQWTPEQIAAGRAREDARREAFYKARSDSVSSWFTRLWRFLLKLLGLSER